MVEGPGGDFYREVRPGAFYTLGEKISIAVIIAGGLALVLLAIVHSSRGGAVMEARLLGKVAGSTPATASPDGSAVSGQQSQITNRKSAIEMTEADLGSGKGEVSLHLTRRVAPLPARSDNRLCIRAQGRDKGRSEPPACGRNGGGISPSLPPTGTARVDPSGDKSPLAGRVRTSEMRTVFTAAPDAVSDDDMDYFWWRESQQGKDPRWKIRGAAGEEGQYRITPIFVAEVERISGYHIDVSNNASCRVGIVIWTNYWAPRVEAETRDELYELYRRGADGYRQWKGGTRR